MVRVLADDTCTCSLYTYLSTHAHTYKLLYHNLQLYALLLRSVDTSFIS